MAANNTDELLWGWQSKIKTIAERGKHILGTDILSDVTFRLGPKDGETVDIKAHKTQADRLSSREINPNAKARDQIWGWQGNTRRIAERAKHILGKDILSDVTLRVVPSNGNAVVDIKAHKLLLAMGSGVFETMFYGTRTEETEVVKIDIDPEPFQLLLRYIYHDQIGPFDKSTAFSTLSAAKKYGVPILKNACEDYLIMNASADNCLTWFVQALTYDESHLASFFMETIDLWGSSVLRSADFRNISIRVLKQILHRDSLNVKEEDVYSAALRWAKQRCNEKKIAYTGQHLRSELREALFLVRFAIMTPEEVAVGPAKLGLLLSDEVNQLFQFWFANEKLPGKFITKPRLLNAEIKLSRFTEEQNGWTYRDGNPDMIEFGFSSTKEIEFPNSITVSLVAVGLYVQNPRPSGYSKPKQCSAIMKIYAGQRYDGIPSNVRTLPDPKGIPITELLEFGNSWTIPATATESKILKFKLNKAVSIKEGIRFTMSIQISGMGQSIYGTGGMQNVTTSVGSRHFTVHFYDASDPDNGRTGSACVPGYNYQTDSYTCGSTTVAKGQIPELYFKITDY